MGVSKHCPRYLEVNILDDTTLGVTRIFAGPVKPEETAMLISEMKVKVKYTSFNLFGGLPFGEVAISVETFRERYLK